MKQSAVFIIYNCGDSDGKESTCNAVGLGLIPGLGRSPGGGQSKPGSQARKGKFIRGKWEGNWPLRRTRVLPFSQGLSYAPPMKWSRSQRSGIWWSRSFEKVGTSEKTKCRLGNLVSIKDHWFDYLFPRST